MGCADACAGRNFERNFDTFGVAVDAPSGLHTYQLSTAQGSVVQTSNKSQARTRTTPSLWIIHITGAHTQPRKVSHARLPFLLNNSLRNWIHRATPASDTSSHLGLYILRGVSEMRRRRKRGSSTTAEDLWFGGRRCTGGGKYIRAGLSELWELVAPSASGSARIRASERELERLAPRSGRLCGQPTCSPPSVRPLEPLPFHSPSKQPRASIIQPLSLRR